MPPINLNARLAGIANMHNSIGVRLSRLAGAHSSIASPVTCDVTECDPGTCESCDYDRATGFTGDRRFSNLTSPTPAPLPIARVVRLGRIRAAIRFIRALAARARTIFRLGPPSNRV